MHAKGGLQGASEVKFIEISPGLLTTLIEHPVTPKTARIIENRPSGQLLILTNATGGPLTVEHASKSVKYYRDRCGLSQHDLGYGLRLYDARGTAAARLLRTGLGLNEIATIMVWSLKHAASMIEVYAEAAPTESDDVLIKLEEFRASEK